MRIVQLVPSLDVGGAERIVGLLARELARLGHTVTVISLFDPVGSWIEEELRAAGMPLHFLGKRPGLDLRMVPRLRRLLGDLRPDILHTHLHTLKYALPAWSGTRAGAVVHTVHNLAEHEVELTGRLVHHIAFRCGVEPVAIGDAVAASLRRVYRITPRHTIPNGIPVADYLAPAGARERVRAALAIPGDTPAFLTVGRLERQKDHAGLLAAFALPALRARGARLLLVGDGPERPALQEQARALGLGDRVAFLGVRTDVPHLLAAADVFVLASRWEGNPLVVMEAMAAGLPVVATSVGCVPELVSDRSGALVSSGDVPALAAAMEALAANPIRARELGAFGARVALERFDVAVMARAYATLYARRVGAGASC
ncbi:MAG: glycosyltransferase [Pseudomonadota bacterium]|nr:glycosyltransferase [Pseudomonadota bacterium]